MSNYVPPTTPMGGPTGQPPGQFPPQQSWPQPPQQKSGVLKWVLIGCGSFFVIGTVIVVLLVWWGVHKAKQAGLDPELLSKKPALAVAKMAVATNPDVEMVSADDSKGTLTVRDKKTGKLLTLDVDEAESGRIVFRGEDGEVLTISAKGQGESGTVEVKSKEGTATFGAGNSAEVPRWLPTYPGATVQANFSAHTGEGQGGTFGFTTDDSIERVTRFYEDALKEAGLKVQTHSIQTDGRVTLNSIAGEDEGKKRTAAIQIMTSEGKSQVTVVFASK